MSDDTRTTLEQAKVCPKCGKIGEVRKETPAKNGRGELVTNLVVYCVDPTELCPWFGTPWVITVNPDGSIPQPYSQIGEKSFPRISSESMTRVEEAIKGQVEVETNRGGHGEIRNPRS